MWSRGERGRVGCERDRGGAGGRGERVMGRGGGGWARRGRLGGVGLGGGGGLGVRMVGRVGAGLWAGREVNGVGGSCAGWCWMGVYVWGEWRLVGGG